MASPTNPSAWRRRLPALGFALMGLSISGYLTLYQIGSVTGIWEPFFGNDSAFILKESRMAHILPVPDAALGFLMYFLEACLGLIGGTNRWRRLPWVVISLGVVAWGLAMAGVGLVMLQTLVIKKFCTLCLVSAAASGIVALLVLDEMKAAINQVMGRKYSLTEATD